MARLYVIFLFLACVAGVESAVEDPFLLVVEPNVIRRISGSTVKNYPISGLRNAIACDYDYKRQIFFFSDVVGDYIKRADLRDGSNVATIATSNVLHPDGIAVDWIAENVYWSDTGTNAIYVARYDGSNRYTLISSGLDQPRALVLYPQKGWMWWTDWGNNPKIERAYMDGSNRQTIVNTGLGWPNGLTFDYDTFKLYWADARTNRIERSNMDGSDRRVLIHGVPHVFGLTLFGANIYWTDWITGAIERASKEGAGRKAILWGFRRPMDVHVVSLFRQTGTNLCAPERNHCKPNHMCLMRPNKLSPVCKTRTYVPNPTLLVVQLNSIWKIVGRSYAQYPITGLKKAVACDYDFHRQIFFFSDVDGDFIKRADLRYGRPVVTIAINNIVQPGGIAVDWIGENVYWCDAGNNAIYVARYDGSNRYTIINSGLDEPRALVLYPQKGWMWWTDWGKSPKIERAYMDGSNRKTIVSTGLGWPNGLTIDYETEKLYFADAKLDKIEMSSMDGSNRRLLINRVPHVFGLTLFGPNIYWTDWERGTLEKASKSGTGRSVILRGFAKPMDLHVVSPSRQTGTNLCASERKHCSHMCLMRADGLPPVCKDAYSPNPGLTLLVAQPDAIWKIVGSTKTRYPISGLKNAVACDYDYNKQIFFFSDVIGDYIKRASLKDGSGVVTIATSNVKNPDGIAVDWIAENVYWSDTGTNAIYVARYDGSNRYTLISSGLDEPRAIVLYPQKGWMWWTDWGKTPKIERAWMDGTHRQTIVDASLARPGGLTFDYNTLKLYWADAKLDKIEMSDMDGSNRRLLISGVPHVFGLTLFGQDLYWTDWTTGSVERAKKDGTGRHILLGGFIRPMALHVVSASRQTGTNLCEPGINFCKGRTCLMRPGARLPVCR